jgi:hypothetical protein
MCAYDYQEKITTKETCAYYHQRNERLLPLEKRPIITTKETYDYHHQRNVRLIPFA